MNVMLITLVGIALGVVSWLSRDNQIDVSPDQSDLRERLDHQESAP